MSTTFSAYRDRINRSLSDWPELSWLNRLLQTPKRDNVDPTLAQVFELVGDRCVGSTTYETAGDFSQALDIEADGSRLRIVLIGHEESWGVDRDMIDVVCSKYQVDPRFLVKHFDYPTVRWEQNCPRDIFDAIEDVIRDYDARKVTKYTWDLGGEVMSSFSMQPGSCFSFAYEAQCLSVAIHEEEHKTHRA